jgi:hypothetical protein
MSLFAQIYFIGKREARGANTVEGDSSSSDSAAAEKSIGRFSKLFSQGYGMPSP